LRPAAVAPELAQIVEDVHAEYFAHLAAVSGLEVHLDPDIAWKVSPAAAWSNCGVRIRFSGAKIKARLDQILARYHANGRGAGFWVGPAATPADLEALLKSRALHCRKYFPAMYCDLGKMRAPQQPRDPVRCEIVTDYGIFRRHPHPSLGRISTAIRRFGFAAQCRLAELTPRCSWDFAAMLDGVPVGIGTVFIGAHHAGVFDVGVLESFRNRGIGRALVRHACEFARCQGAEGAILIATNLGYGVYEHVGFREVARFGFWYTARP
jgi:GNAT superfamily N-acetyltransferase